MSRSIRGDKAILIVDDDEEYCELMAELIDRMGYRPVAVNDGISALKQIDEQHFVLALIDYQMPGMTGAQLLRRMRRKKIRTPVIIITGMDDQQVEEELQKLEAASILKKPLQMDQFQNAIEQWLKSPPRDKSRG